MPDNDDNDFKIVEDVMLKSGNAIGQGSSAALGFVIGGPVGAAFGAVSSLIVQTGADVLRRKLSTRQTTRIGTLLNAARDTLGARVMNGAQIRSDDFFEQNGTQNSNFEEMFEDLLRSVTETIEERKIPYMANMLARFILDDDYQVYKMRDLIRRVEGLSYLQLQLLVIMNDEANLQSGELIWIGNKTFEGRALDLSLEKTRMQSLGITAAQNVSEIDENNCRPSPQLSMLGKEIYELMELLKVPQDCIAALKSELLKAGVCKLAHEA